jgi:hypothetical protein
MDESLSSLYARADALRRQIDDGSIDGFQVIFRCFWKTNGEQNRVQECITLYEQCKQLVERLALFSENESADDVASTELK